MGLADTEKGRANIMATVTATKMTADDARTFHTFSVSNAARVEEHTAEVLGCGCQAYVDVFTFRRWIAQGMVVRKGEKAIRIPVRIPIRKRDKTTGEQAIVGTTAKMVSVFCRHSVKPLEK
jgi:hypothetical protein